MNITTVELIDGDALTLNMYGAFRVAPEGVYVTYSWGGSGVLIPWHRVRLVHMAAPDVSLYDMETGACKCEVKDEHTDYGSCAHCNHAAHDSRKYCGALR